MRKLIDLRLWFEDINNKNIVQKWNVIIGLLIFDLFVLIFIILFCYIKLRYLFEIIIIADPNFLGILWKAYEVPWQHYKELLEQIKAILESNSK